MLYRVCLLAMAMWLLLLRSQLGPLRLSWIRMMLTDDYKMSVTQRNTHLTITQQGRLSPLIGGDKSPSIFSLPCPLFPSFFHFSPLPISLLHPFPLFSWSITCKHRNVLDPCEYTIFMLFRQNNQRKILINNSLYIVELCRKPD